MKTSAPALVTVMTIIAVTTAVTALIAATPCAAAEKPQAELSGEWKLTLPAFWKTLEIDSIDHGGSDRFRQRFAAVDYRKLAGPGPLTLSRQRIEEIAKLLPEEPSAMGPRIGDRAAWEAFATRNPGSDFIARADEALRTPTPALPDERFLGYKKKGVSPRRAKTIQVRKHYVTTRAPDGKTISRS